MSTPLSVRAAARTAFHEAGMVHGDLKPGNVLFSGNRPVVIDFDGAVTTDLDAIPALARAIADNLAEPLPAPAPLPAPIPSIAATASPSRGTSALP